MSDLNNLYQDYWQYQDNKIGNGYTLLEIAAVSLACALSIYKTTLCEEDFDQMIDYINENRDSVKSITIDNSIH